LDSKDRGYHYLDSFYDKDANTLALFAINHKEKELVLVFRGSYNMANILMDFDLAFCDVELDAKRVPLEHKIPLMMEPRAKIHKGFKKATKSSYPHVVKKLDHYLKNYPDYHLVITGCELKIS
jgi:hypothetical protein